MSAGQVHIRAEAAGDAAAIAAVTTAAFAGVPYSDQREAQIVAALRARGELAVSLVAECDGQVVGHVAASPVRISDGTGGWYGLGPLSVLPALHGQGIGTALVHAALARLRAMGADGCVLLGEPDYYARFGFRAEPALVLEGVPAAYFQALPLAGGLPHGTVHYSPAFAA